MAAINGAQLGMEAAGSLVDFGLGQWGANIQQQRNKEMADYNQKLNQEMAQFQQGLNKEMFDYTYKTQGDKVKELKDAGLSTALMYGSGLQGGGGSTQGGTSGTSGQQGGNAPQINPMDMANIQMQKELNDAIIKEKEADAKLKEIDAATRARKNEMDIQIQNEIKEKMFQEGMGTLFDNIIKEFPLRERDYAIWDTEHYGEWLMEKEGYTMKYKLSELAKIYMETESIQQGVSESKAKMREIIASAILKEEDFKYYAQKFAIELANSNYQGMQATASVMSNILNSKKISYDIGETWNVKQVIEALKGITGAVTSAVIATKKGK